MHQIVPTFEQVKDTDGTRWVYDRSVANVFPPSLWGNAVRSLDSVTTAQGMQLAAHSLILNATARYNRFGLRGLRDNRFQFKHYTEEGSSLTARFRHHSHNHTTTLSYVSFSDTDGRFSIGYPTPQPGRFNNSFAVVDFAADQDTDKSSQHEVAASGDDSITPLQRAMSAHVRDAMIDFLDGYQPGLELPKWYAIVSSLSGSKSS